MKSPVFLENNINSQIKIQGLPNNLTSWNIPEQPKKKQNGEKIFAPKCALQQYPQQPKFGHNPNVKEKKKQMTGYRNYGTQWNID